MMKKTLMLSAAFAVGTIQAAAQTQVQDGEALLEEIIVTAQKRPQALGDVPIAISVMTGDTLAESGAKNLLEAQGTVPGLYISGDGAYGTSPLSIRGTGGSGTVMGDEPVAVYIDGVYIGRSAGIGTSDLLDVASVEVVRGPQGTLQGRNATAGAVIIRSRDPGSRTEGYVRVSGADPQEFQAQAAVGTPLTDTLGLRLAAGYTDDRGWADNLVTGGHLGKSETQQVRGTLLWQPVDPLKVRLSADWSQAKTNIAIARNAATPAIRPPAPFVGTPDIPLSDAAADLALDGQLSLNDPHHSNQKTGGAVVDATWSLDAVDLVSISAWRWADVSGAQDSDGTGLEIGYNTNEADNEQWSQELRVQSAGDTAVQWTVGGLYYFENQNLDPFVIYNFLAGPPNPAGKLGYAGTRAEFRSAQDTASWAGFADGRWEFMAGTGLTLGGRYTWEEKSFIMSRDVYFDLTNIHLPFPSSNALPERTKSWSDFSYRVVLDHKFEDGTLVYGKYSTGFKSGGFNAYGEEAPYDPEEIKSWEIGIKGDLADRRLTLSASAYSNSYNNLQIRAGVASGGIIVTNAADSKIKGVETEFTWRAGNGFVLDGSAAYTDAVFKSFTNARDARDQPVDATGNHLPRAPEWQFAVNASQTVSIGDYDLTGKVGYHWRDKVWFLQTDQGLPTFRGDSLGELDARLQLSPSGEEWSIALFGRNLTDERVVNNVMPFFSYPIASFNKPRVIGVQAEVTF